MDINELQATRANLEGQISNLKMERDRILEVSQNLRIQMNKLEKQQLMNKLRFSDQDLQNHGWPEVARSQQTSLKAAEHMAKTASASKTIVY
jgi:hypothetical protein